MASEPRTQGPTRARPRVDLVVPVHTSTRPIARAVGSALRNLVPLRVTVVAHNIQPGVIGASLGALRDDPRVRLVALQDGIPSPAGPMNHGLQLGAADFLAVMGSDDELEAGALDAWVDLADRKRADMVIAPVHHLGEAPDPYPPVRIGRASRLSPIRDRLSYRSAPLGIFARAKFGQLRFAEGLKSGEDLPFVTRLWFSGGRIVFDRSSPAYLIHADEPDRVTGLPRPLAEDFDFLDVIEADPLFATLGRRARRALTVKILRIHVFDAIAARVTDAGLSDESRDELRLVIERLRGWSRGVERLLAISDRRALGAAQRADSTPAELRGHLADRWRYGAPATLISGNPLLSLHSQGPFRTLLAGTRVRRAIAAGLSRRGGVG